MGEKNSISGRLNSWIFYQAAVEGITFISEAAGVQSQKQFGRYPSFGASNNDRRVNFPKNNLPTLWVIENVHLGLRVRRSPYRG